MNHAQAALFSTSDTDKSMCDTLLKFGIAVPYFFALFFYSNSARSEMLDCSRVWHPIKPPLHKRNAESETYRVGT